MSKEIPMTNIEEVRLRQVFVACASSLFRYSTFGFRNSSQLQIDNTIGRHDGIFVFHIFARAQVDGATGRFHQNPSGGDVPQTDSAFDVSVEPTARDVSQVERGT